MNTIMLILDTNVISESEDQSLGFRYYWMNVHEPPRCSNHALIPNCVLARDWAKDTGVAKGCCNRLSASGPLPVKAF